MAEVRPYATKQAKLMYQEIVLRNILAGLRFPLPRLCYMPHEKPDWYPEVSPKLAQDILAPYWSRVARFQVSLIAGIPFAEVTRNRVKARPHRPPLLGQPPTPEEPSSTPPSSEESSPTEEYPPSLPPILRTVGEPETPQEPRSIEDGLRS